MDNSTIIPYNSYEERIVLACIVLFISAFGAVGNIMVITAVGLSKTLRTKTNIFVVNLSIADLSACLAMPWSSIALLSKDQWLLPGTEGLCQVSGMIVFISIGCSMWNLTFIAINRLVLITRSFSMYQKVCSPCAITVMVLLSWIIPVTLISIPTLVGFGKIGFERHRHTCVEILSTPQAEKYDIYQSIVTGLLLLTIAICYVLIYIHVRRHFKNTEHLHDTPLAGNHQEPSTSTDHTSLPSTPTTSSSTYTKGVVHHRDTKKRRDMVEITKNLFIVVCVLLVCLIPFIVVDSVDSLPDSLEVYAATITLVNSSLNPLIYAWRHPHFKVVLRLMMRCRYRKIPRPSNILRKFLQ
ncbi:melatonin receptor type 1B-A-like [Amphiura filiformis]|uniref:melatonin receptor type 1B-A-like n=1 Tax=Amphiura filiformis TaxID=82378 RepID=UPI003B212E16